MTRDFFQILMLGPLSKLLPSRILVYLWIRIKTWNYTSFLTPTLAELDIANAGGWCLWRHLSFFSILNKSVRMKLRIIRKICSRPINIVSHKIDFTADGLHRDHPQACWSLIKKHFSVSGNRNRFNDINYEIWNSF